MLSAEAMESMNSKELGQRIKWWKAKKEKLQNPNFHVSRTRLSVKNIPLFVTDKLLRTVFIEKALQIRKQMEQQKGGDDAESDNIFEAKFPKIVQAMIVRE